MNRAATIACVLALAAAQAPRAQPISSIEAATTACRLWGTARYLHPDIESPGVDWDAAWAAAFPAIDAARQPRQLVDALNMMLAALGDPSSRAFVAGPRAAWSAAASELDERTAVLRVQAGSGPEGFAEALAQARALATSLRARPRGLILDLAAGEGADPDDGSIDRLLTESGLLALLYRAPPAPLSERVRFYSGLPPADGRNLPGYEASFLVRARRTLEPQQGGIRAVFVTSASSFLPLLALELHEAGEAGIVSVGPVPTRGAHRFVELPLAAGIRGRVRTSELITHDGRIGTVADVVIAPGAGGEDHAAALREAARWLRESHALARSPVQEPKPAFRPDARYESMRHPGKAWRVLALCKAWTAVQLFYPYRAGMPEAWEAVLPDMVPAFADAEGAQAYALVIARLMARTRDQHSVVTAEALDDYWGRWWPPIRVSHVEERWVVAGFARDAEGVEGIARGDEIVALDGQPLAALWERRTPYMAAATPQALRLRFGQTLLGGAQDSRVSVTLRSGNGNTRTVQLVRRHKGTDFAAPPAAAWRPAEPDIGYVNLPALEPAQVDAMFDALGKARAILFDLRGYPQGTGAAIAARLGHRTSPAAARFDRPIVTAPIRNTPDEERTTTTFFSHVPADDRPRFTGLVGIILDERTVSQAEFAAMQIRAASDALVIGSPSAGTDGDITSFFLPGGIRVWLTGQAVSWPDGRPQQRVGIIPDVIARPTLRALKAGEDAVLLEALAALRRRLDRPPG